MVAEYYQQDSPYLRYKFGTIEGKAHLQLSQLWSVQHAICSYTSTKFSHSRFMKGTIRCTLVQALRICTGHTAHRGSRGIALIFPDHGTRQGVRGQCHVPAALYPGKRPSTHCTGGWVSPIAGLDRCGKSRPPPGFDPQTVQPVASHYTDYATRSTVDSWG